MRTTCVVVEELEAEPVSERELALAGWFEMKRSAAVEAIEAEVTEVAPAVDIEALRRRVEEEEMLAIEWMERAGSYEIINYLLDEAIKNPTADRLVMLGVATAALAPELTPQMAEAAAMIDFLGEGR